MRIVTVFGTRPEAIKMAPIIRAATAAEIETHVCVTAQHRDMLDQMLRVFSIAPDHDLNLMQEDQTPSQFAARVLETLPAVLRNIRPDWLLLQGDTTTAFAAAFAAEGVLKASDSCGIEQVPTMWGETEKNVF